METTNKQEQQKQEKEFISYKEATKDLKLILCNEITEHFELTNYLNRYSDYIDADLIKEVYEDEFYEDEDERQEAIKEMAMERAEEDEIFQYYLTNASQYDAEWYSEIYGLKFAYCDELDIWVLLVNHYGSSWEDVKVEVIG